MKRIFASLFALLFLCAGAAACFAAAPADGSLDPVAQGGVLDIKLKNAVARELSGATVKDAYQSIVLFDESLRIQVQNAAGVLREMETSLDLNAGDRVSVLADSAYLKLYTTAKVLARDEDSFEEEEVEEKDPSFTLPEEAMDKEERAADKALSAESQTRAIRYEIKTLHLASGTVLSVLAATDGLKICLENGSVTVENSTDPFGLSPLALCTDALVAQGGEAVFTLGKNEFGSGILVPQDDAGAPTLLDARQKTLTGGESCRFLEYDIDEAKQYPAQYMRRIGIHVAQAPVGSIREKTQPSPFLEDHIESREFVFDSVFSAARKSSAVSAVLSAYTGEKDLFKRMEEWENRRSGRLVEALFAREDLRLAMEASLRQQREAGGLVRPVRAAIFTDLESLAGVSPDPAKTLVLPASSAAYTVVPEGVVELKDGADSFSFTVTLKKPLADGDALALSFGEAALIGESADNVQFSYTLTGLAAAPSGAVSLEYSTAAPYLFLPADTAEYRLDPNEAPVALTPQTPFTFSVELSRALSARDEFAVYANDKALTPARAGESETTFLFTVTPDAESLYISVRYRTVYRLSFTFGEAFCDCFALYLPGNSLLAVSGQSVPFFLQKTVKTSLGAAARETRGDASVVLKAGENGGFVCEKIDADCHISLSLGYALTLPESTDLFIVRPEEGYSAAFAEYGADYRFRVALTEVAAPGTSLLVKNNGVTVIPNAEGVYVLENVRQAPLISIAYGVTYNIFLPTGTSYTVSPYGGDSTTVMENGSFRFTLELLPTVSASQLIVAANATVLRADANGIYTISNITQDIAVTVRLISSFRVVLPVGDLYTVTPYGDSSTTVLSGGSFRFTVQLSDTVSLGSALTVKANEQALTPLGGVYSMSNIQGDVYVTVSVRMLYTVTLPASDADFSVSAPSSTVLYGDSYSFTVTPNTGKTAVVRANGKILTGANGVYTIARVYCDLYISLEKSGSQEQFSVTLVSAFSHPIKAAELLSGDSTTHDDRVLVLVTAENQIGAPAPVVSATSGALALTRRIETLEEVFYLYTLRHVTANTTVTVS